MPAIANLYRRLRGGDRETSRRRPHAMRLAIVAFLGLVFIGVAFASLFHLVREREAYAHLIRSNAWIVNQIEFEILRFTRELDRYRLADSGVEPAEVQRRFDILWSRLPVALKGVEAAGLRQIPDAVPAMEALQATLERYDPTILALEDADPATLRTIAETLTTHRRTMHDLALSMHLGTGHDRLLARVEESQTRTLVAVGALILVGVLAAGMLVLEVHRSRRSFEREHALRVEADAANHAKSLFLANMSHELRTPLNAIMGFAQVMRDELFGAIGNDRYRTYVRDIHDSAAHLLGVLSELLDMARIETGSLRLEPETANLSEQIDRSLTILCSDIERKGITVERSGEERMPLLHCDTRMMRQILVNLVSNAVKFSEAGGTVGIRCGLEDDRPTIRVVDAGTGIAPDDLARLHEPFYQGENARQASQGGSGLGLALVHALTEAHGGRFTLENAPHGGVIATVVLPAERCVGAEQAVA